MTKKTLVFDASILCCVLHKNSSRSGIFFTAINLFEQFINDPRFDVRIYIDNIEAQATQQYLEQKYNRHFPLYGKDKNRIDRCLAALTNYRDKCRKQHRFLERLIAAFPVRILRLLRRIHKRRVARQKMPMVDIFFSPCFKIPENVNAKKKYILLHDVIPIILKEYFNYDDSDWFTQMCKSLNSNDYYFTNSDATRNDFLRIFPQINPAHIKTTLLASSDRFCPETNADVINAARKKYGIPTDKKYVFSLCTLEPRKNLIRAIKAFIEFIKKNKVDDMVYVLGGGHWDKFIGKLQDEIKDLGKYQDKIIRAGYIDDEDLTALYSGAQWFVYTSQYEGFGLPVLEAMQCGCPVITSNNSSLPEVVGNSAITLDWDSDKQHVAAYEKYYFDPDFRQKMATAGLQRSKTFSWKKCAEQMSECFLA